MMRCALFFNPAQAFYSEKVSFRAKLNDSVLLDTIIKNSRVDNSKLLKCFNFEASKDQILSINVNGKEQKIRLTHKRSKILNIFVTIDDHFLLDLKQKRLALGIFPLATNRKTSMRKILDSLRSNALNNEYDSIGIVIKNEKCYCEN